MDLQFFELLALFSMSFVMCVFMLLGFALGAYVVYRTRRDSSEPFMAPKAMEGDAGQVPEDYSGQPEMPAFWQGAAQSPGEETDGSEVPEGGDVDNILYGKNGRAQKFKEDLNGVFGK